MKKIHKNKNTGYAAQCSILGVEVSAVQWSSVYGWGIVWIFFFSISRTKKSQNFFWKCPSSLGKATVSLQSCQKWGQEQGKFLCWENLPIFNLFVFIFLHTSCVIWVCTLWTKLSEATSTNVIYCRLYNTYLTVQCIYLQPPHFQLELPSSTFQLSPWAPLWINRVKLKESMNAPGSRCLNR